MPNIPKSVTNKRTVRRRIPQWALHEQQMPFSDRYLLRAVVRAAEVLDTFDGTQPLSLKEIRARTMLPESTLYRVLLSFEHCGYLIQQVDGTYQLAPKLRIGWQMKRANLFREKFHPELEQMANRFNETASIAYLIDDHIQVLDCVETFHEIRISNRIGRVLPPHCSAMGKAITAFQENALRERILDVYGLFPRTPHTIVDRFKLFNEFDEIIRTGIAYDREESVLGSQCIGAVIRHNKEIPFSAISISIPIVRMTPEREQEICEAVLQTANRIAKSLY
jgi:DNA-binding IclR family transcriptional regulator